LKLADAEGLDAVTIRRLAQDLGVTPMALYWHFKNKDELLVGLVDHAFAAVSATPIGADPWQQQLRAMVESLVSVMREHASLSDLLFAVDKQTVASFIRATDHALELLTRGGFSLEEGYWVASYLLHSCIGLVAAQPGCPVGIAIAEAAEWRRQKRLALETLPQDQFPQLVAYARTLETEPDVDRYFRFGVDLLIGAVEAQARS
jgi:AcrR family transcriptional regulator